MAVAWGQGEVPGLVSALLAPRLSLPLHCLQLLLLCGGEGSSCSGTWQAVFCSDHFQSLHGLQALLLSGHCERGCSTGSELSPGFCQEGDMCVSPGQLFPWA